MSAKKNMPVVDWLKIEASAPGKFIISGEYSVIYDKQAIAAAIDLRTNVTITPNDDGCVRLKLKDLKTERSWPVSSLASYRLVAKNSMLEYNDSMIAPLVNLLNAQYCTETGNPSASSSDKDEEQVASERKDITKKADDAAMAFLLLYIGIGDSFSNSARLPIDVEVESSIPVGSGLGSSSAYAVALTGALMKVFLASVERYIISNWSFNIDKFFHGRPSGVDNSIVTVGNYILFQNGKIKAHGVTTKPSMKVLLVDTNISRSTRALCDKVAKSLREDPAAMSDRFNKINDITTLIWRSMVDIDFAPIHIAGQLANNQRHLEMLGVGHEKLTDIQKKAEEFGFTAKQTGAGGGGTAFILYDSAQDNQRIDKLKDIFVAAGYGVHDHKVGCEGLKVKVTADPEKRFVLGDS